jgi:hypothetical protein
VADGDLDNDGVADELELTVTFLFDPDEGDPADARADVLGRIKLMKLYRVIADFRVHDGA